MSDVKHVVPKPAPGYRKVGVTLEDWERPLTGSALVTAKCQLAARFDRNWEVR